MSVYEEFCVIILTTQIFTTLLPFQHKKFSETEEIENKIKTLKQFNLFCENWS